VEISFLGGAGSVTGSCFHLKVNGLNLLVDCGMFQGKDGIEGRNSEPFNFEVDSIDYLLLTHAHIDHSGRIPLLYKKGFKGKVLSTAATFDLCQIMLRDAAHILEMEAEWQNRKAKRAGKKPVAPLYTMEEAVSSLERFQPVHYGEEVDLGHGVRVRFLDAGHILGSSMVEVFASEPKGTTKVVFSGDLGNKDQPIIRDPVPVDYADVLVVESTYGNRLHEDKKFSVEKLVCILRSTVERGGNVIIPAFAVERTQELIFTMNQLVESGQIPPIPVYIDSPMAISATEIFRRHPECFDRETSMMLFSGDDPLRFPGLGFTRTTEESKALNSLKGGGVIISASGMCEAGRIKHHLKHNLWRPECTVLIVGFMAQGTLGRRLQEGVKKVRIYGEEVQVRAEIQTLAGFSAHADQKGLLEWLEGFSRLPQRIFLVHGEKEASGELGRQIKKVFGLKAEIPASGQVFDLKNHRVSDLGAGWMVEKGAAGRQRLLALRERFERVLEFVSRSPLDPDGAFPVEQEYYLDELEELLMEFEGILGEGLEQAR